MLERIACPSATPKRRLTEVIASIKWQVSAAGEPPGAEGHVLSLSNIAQVRTSNILKRLERLILGVLGPQQSEIYLRQPSPLTGRHFAPMPGGRLSGLRCPRTEAVALVEVKVFGAAARHLGVTPSCGSVPAKGSPPEAKTPPA